MDIEQAKLKLRGHQAAELRFHLQGLHFCEVRESFGGVKAEDSALWAQSTDGLRSLGVDPSPDAPAGAADPSDPAGSVYHYRCLIKITPAELTLLPPPKGLARMFYVAQALSGALVSAHGKRVGDLTSLECIALADKAGLPIKVGVGGPGNAGVSGVSLRTKYPIAISEVGGVFVVREGQLPEHLK